MNARIFRPTKTAMQSGKAATRKWRLEFRADAPRRLDPLMGWTSIDGARNQVRLEFDTREQAVAYASEHEIAATVFEPRARPLKLRSYADNFAHNRVI